MCEKYTIGVDFGSLSARAAIFDVGNGGLTGSCEQEYAHGIISDSLPGSGEPLPPDSALQAPADFLKALEKSVRGALEITGVRPEHVVGLSLDFTSCTLVALDRNRQPLCLQERFRKNPHAYAKMWKQHTATEEANEITEKALARNPASIARYGGKILSEWAIPKILETLRKAPEVYAAAFRFMEAGDWLTWLLTGQESMSDCSAGYKFMWRPGMGYPAPDEFAAFDEGLRDLTKKLVPEDRILPLDACAGRLDAAGARLTGLNPGTPVAPMRIDGHSSAVAVGCHTPGQMVAIAGTSLGLILNSDREVCFPGLCGVSYGAVVPGLYGYEAGLSSCGDIYEWFVTNCVPDSYRLAAQTAGVSDLAYLSGLAGKLRPGESGLIAVDWWNGNRSLLADTDLGGMLFGLSLQTKPEEILRALFEATAFSVRMIVGAFDRNGVPVEMLRAVGGIAEKNPVLMQLFADILKREIVVPDVKHACALGSAIYAAVAAGSAGGGYDTIEDAVAHMAHAEGRRYVPNTADAQRYDELFAEFRTLHDYFGRSSSVLKTLNRLKRESLS